MTSTFFYSLIYTSFWVVMIVVTKVMTQSVKIETSMFRKVTALLVQNLVAAAGWFVLIANVRTYMLGACIFCVFHIIEDLFVVKAYQRQKTATMIGNTFLAWLFWPHYNGFDIFCRIYSSELIVTLITMDKNKNPDRDE